MFWDADKPEWSMIIRNDLEAFSLPNFINEDIVTVSLESEFRDRS